MNHGTPWRQAFRVAADMAATPPTRIALMSAVGTMLAQPVVAQTDIPPLLAAATNGYAVRGIGPWGVVGPGEELADGQAAPIRTGDPVPPGAAAVLPDSHAVGESGPELVLVGDPATGRPSSRPGMVDPGSGMLDRGVQARAGDVLAKPGTVVTAGTVALAAAAGMDELVITPPATVTPVLMESDLLESGPPRRGRNRDVVAPLLAAWLLGSGARSLPEVPGSSDPRALAAAIDAAGSDLTVVTATAHPGIGSAVTSALDLLGAETLIDRLAARPADAVLLAELRDGRRVLALPREPAAAAVVMALLLTPMISALSGRPASRMRSVMLRDGVPQTHGERAVAIQIDEGELADLAVVQPWSGPSGLGAIGTCDAIAFIEAGRGNRGDSVPAMELPGRV